MGTQITPIEEVKQNLTRMQTDFKMVLPPHISPEKFVRVLVTAVQNNPDLLSADRASLYNAGIKCAQDGLIPDGREAVLTTAKGMVVYMPMIQGVLKKVRNSGELASADAQVVYANDEYESWLDEKGQHFKHKKSITDRGEPILTYAYALTKDGALYFEEVTEEQMGKIESMAKTSYVWKGAFRDEMKRKSALHRLSKRLPMSTDLQNVITRDEELYELPTVPVAPAKPTSSRLDNIIETQVTPAAPEPGTGTPPAPNGAGEEKPEPAGNKTTEGVIGECKFKAGETNGKAWTKYGIKIAENWYATFDTKIYEACLELKNHGNVLCHVEYSENQYGRELLAIRAKSAEEIGIPI